MPRTLRSLGWTAAATVACATVYLSPGYAQQVARVGADVYSQPPALDRSLDLTQYTHRAWTAFDGLKGSTRSIVQTPDGYLWLGTEFGIVRFDGVHFVPWTPPLGESLPSTNINTLLAARDGTLWIGTLEGLVSWNSDKLTQYPDFAGGSSHVLLEDHEGTVWVGASGKLCAIRAKKIECYGYGTSSVTGLHYLYSNQITASSMYEDSDYRLWVGTETGLWRWKPGTPKRYMPQPLIANQAVVPGDRAGELVFISGVKNDLRQLAGQRINEYTVPGIRRAVNASSLLRDRNGALWIGTYDQGLLRVYQGKTSRFAIGEGLSGNLVTALFEDREGSVWVGTTNGVDRFSEPVISTLSAFQGLPSPAWSVLPARDGSLWIGSFDGLSRWWQGQLTTYRSTRMSGKQIGIGQSTSVSGAVHEILDPGLPDNNIGSLFEDKRGRIWITTSKGIARFENGRFTSVNGLPDGSSNAIVADEHDGIWISYPTQGLFHVLHDTVDQSTPWPWPNEGKDPRVSAIVPAPLSSGLWLGSINEGIARFNDGQVSKWLGGKDGLGANLVWNLHVDHEGTLWAATEGGLSRIKDGSVSTLTTKSGLPCNAVHWVTEDDASSLWLSTVCGLLRVDRSELQAWTSDAKHAIHATMFDGSDGFRSHAMLIGYSPVVKKAPDGKLWFAHNDGVSVIDPRNLRLNTVVPPVHIEAVRADGRAYDHTVGLRLPSRVRDLSIDFTALSLVAPEKVHFRFKLDGQDEHWREVVNQRRVEYSNLPPGDYRFRVTASNNNGVWNEGGAVLAFSVAPAYYQTSWFRVLAAVAFVGVLSLVYQSRIRQLRGQERKLRDVVDTIPTSTWTALPDGTIDFVNHHWQEFTGLSLERLGRSGWREAVHPDDVQPVFERVRASFVTGEPLEHEVRYRRAADGQYRWFLLRAVPLRDGRGKIVKWYGTATDIEDHKRAEEERERLRSDIAHLNRVSMLGELAASLSHELKQPIAAAVTNAHTSIRWLKRETPGVNEAIEASMRIATAGNRAAEIIDHLRTLYKKSPQQRGRIDVNDIVLEMLALLRGESDRYSIVMLTDLAAGLPNVTADRVQLQQVLMNLMLNAFEAMKEAGGELMIATMAEAGQLKISVSDTGVGLPHETSEQIFDAFFTTKPDGSGMGLSISRSIVEAHGGRLWAAGNAGRGATFTFTLPIPSAES